MRNTRYKNWELNKHEIQNNFRMACRIRTSPYRCGVCRSVFVLTRIVFRISNGFFLAEVGATISIVYYVQTGVPSPYWWAIKSAPDRPRVDSRASEIDACSDFRFRTGGKRSLRTSNVRGIRPAALATRSTPFWQRRVRRLAEIDRENADLISDRGPVGVPFTVRTRTATKRPYYCIANKQQLHHRDLTRSLDTIIVFCP